MGRLGTRCSIGGQPVDDRLDRARCVQLDFAAGSASMRLDPTIHVAFRNTSPILMVEYILAQQARLQTSRALAPVHHVQSCLVCQHDAQ